MYLQLFSIKFSAQKFLSQSRILIKPVIIYEYLSKFKAIAACNFLRPMALPVLSVDSWLSLRNFENNDKTNP